MDVPNTYAVLIIAGFVVVLLVVSGIFTMKDKYLRTNLGGQNVPFRNTPVDYAFKYPGVPSMPVGQPSWEMGNPHYWTDPQDKYHQLEEGFVDLYRDERKLNPTNYPTIWDQYGNDYYGSGLQKKYVVDDARTRALLREMGDEPTRRMLDTVHTNAHGPYSTTAVSNIESEYVSPDPYLGDQKLYVGYDFMRPDRFVN